MNTLDIISEARAIRDGLPDGHLAVQQFDDLQADYYQAVQQGKLGPQKALLILMNGFIRRFRYLVPLELETI